MYTLRRRGVFAASETAAKIPAAAGCFAGSRGSPVASLPGF